jgi:hypothetical protein
LARRSNGFQNRQAARLGGGKVDINQRLRPWICQPGAAPGEPPPITVVPLMSQITACPVLELYQTMSLLPTGNQTLTPPSSPYLGDELLERERLRQKLELVRVG